MKNILLAVIAALSMTACLDDAARLAVVATVHNIEKKEQPEKNSRYVHDLRTNLCFIVANENMTNVPCTPEVLAEVEKADALHKPQTKKD